MKATTNPLIGNKDEIMIDAIWGLDKSIFCGLVIINTILIK